MSASTRIAVLDRNTHGSGSKKTLVAVPRRGSQRRAAGRKSTLNSRDDRQGKSALSLDETTTMFQGQTRHFVKLQTSAMAPIKPPTWPISALLAMWREACLGLSCPMAEGLA